MLKLNALVSQEPMILLVIVVNLGPPRLLNEFEWTLCTIEVIGAVCHPRKHFLHIVFHQYME